MENSWQCFIQDLQKEANSEIPTLNPHRALIMKDNKSRKKIILNEIKRYNYNSPLEVVDMNYIREYYDTNLLIDQLKSITDIFNTVKSFPEIMDKKEKLELKKKIITQYLTYLVSKHFQQILEELTKLNKTEHTLDLSLIQIKNLKVNLSEFKTKYITLSMTIVRRKQKYKNLCKLKNLLKDTMAVWYTHLQEAKKIKKRNEYADLFMKYSEIQENIADWSKNHKNFLIADNIILKLKKRMEKVKVHFDGILSSIFEEKKTDLQNIYILFCKIKVLSTQNPLEAFKFALRKSMRDSIFHFAKNIISPNTNIYTIDIEKIEKFSIFKLYVLKEEEFFDVIPSILSKIITIGECYNYYTVEKGDSVIGKLLIDEAQNFYNLCEKKITKILKYLGPTLANSLTTIKFQEPFLQYISCINIFTLTLQNYFNYHVSKFIKPYIIDTVKNQFNYSIKYYIKKICFGLCSDTWHRIPYEEKYLLPVTYMRKTNDNFNPHNYHQFLPFFNEDAYNFINNINELSDSAYENVRELFDKFITEKNEVLSNIKYNKKINSNKSTKNISLKSVVSVRRKSLSSSNINFTEEIKNLIVISSKDILTEATIISIKYIKQFSSNIYLYNSLKDFIYEKILNLFEYYFIGSITILMFNKQYFEQIFKIVDVVNMKKSGGLISSSEFANFLESFMDLREFLVKATKNFNELYDGAVVNFLDDSNKITNNSINDNIEVNKIMFPKLNPTIILDPSNKYCLLIESIVLVESVYSLYKFIKHYKKKLYSNNNDENIKIEKIIDDNDSSSEQFNKILELYKKALKQLTAYLYKPLCLNILIINPIINKIKNRKWDITEKPKINDGNNFIDLLVDEILEKIDKLELLSGWSLTEKSFMRFFYVLFDVIINKLFDTLANIKNWSEQGRQLFVEDMFLFKSKLLEKFSEKNIKPDIDSYFNKLIQYINAWYYNEEQILNYITEDKIEYKYIKSIVEYGQHFKDKNPNDKKVFLTKIEELYYGNILSLNEKLIAIK